MRTIGNEPSPKVAEWCALLGSSGTAKVYRASDGSLGCTIAPKRLTSTDPSAAALFEAELHTSVGLRHPSIGEVFDYGVDAERPFSTMELLEGEDVGALAPLPWRLVCECLRDIGGALALIHVREFVHRDITPATQSILPRAYDLAGKPDKAKAFCLSALDDADRELVAMNLIVLTEPALAERRTAIRRVATSSR